MRYAGLGIQLAVAVGAGVLVGQWIDHRAGNNGLFAILGGLLGFAGTMYSLLRQLNRPGRGKE